jgi:hypothetical protein
MSKSNKKLSIALSILLFLAVLVLATFFPSTGLILGLGLLLFSFGVTSIAIVKKHWQAYQQGEITRVAFVRSSFFEVLVVFLTMTLAGLMGRYFARIATAPIPAEFPKLVAGLLVGASVGAGVGLLVKRARGRLARDV